MHVRDSSDEVQDGLVTKLKHGMKKRITEVNFL